ncbi:hypothetical protein [Streptomyces ardesiacus]|uniref:hypothetical protein n=1 Tax=Streptomyces ardesiacus TaxID=285564 RepID=UPI0037FE0649
MRKLSFESPRKWLSVGPALRKVGMPNIPGRYRVASYIGGSLTGPKTLSRRGAIRTFQHYSRKGF